MLTVVSQHHDIETLTQTELSDAIKKRRDDVVHALQLSVYLQKYAKDVSSE